MDDKTFDTALFVLMVQGTVRTLSAFTIFAFMLQFGALLENPGLRILQLLMLILFSSLLAAAIGNILSWLLCASFSRNSHKPRQDKLRSELNELCKKLGATLWVAGMGPIGILARIGIMAEFFVARDLLVSFGLSLLAVMVLQRMIVVLADRRRLDFVTISPTAS